MKHLIILGDGMADWAVPSLGNKTLLQYAHTPYMDMLARMGRTGMLKTVADGFHPGLRCTKGVVYWKPQASESIWLPMTWRCVATWYVSKGIC